MSIINVPIYVWLSRCYTHISLFQSNQMNWFKLIDSVPSHTVGSHFNLQSTIYSVSIRVLISVHIFPRPIDWLKLTLMRNEHNVNWMKYHTKCICIGWFLLIHFDCIATAAAAASTNVTQHSYLLSLNNFKKFIHFKNVRFKTINSSFRSRLSCEKKTKYSEVKGFILLIELWAKRMGKHDQIENCV